MRPYGTAKNSSPTTSTNSVSKKSSNDNDKNLNSAPKIKNNAADIGAIIFIGGITCFLILIIVLGIIHFYLSK